MPPAGVSPAPAATRAPPPRLPARPPTARPLPARRTPPGRPSASPARGVHSGRGRFPLHFLPSPTQPSRRPAASRLPPPPPGSRASPGARRWRTLTCHVPDPAAEGGASRPREGRGRHFQADKGRRHVRVGRNRPRRLPGCDFRRRRSARAGPRGGLAHAPGCRAGDPSWRTWSCSHRGLSLASCPGSESDGCDRLRADGAPGTVLSP